MRRYLMLFSTLARFVSQSLDNKKDDINTYVDAYKGARIAIDKLKSLSCYDIQPVYCAAKQGNAAAIITLADVGADVNAQSQLWAQHRFIRLLKTGMCQHWLLCWRQEQMPVLEYHDGGGHT